MGEQLGLPASRLTARTRKRLATSCRAACICILLAGSASLGAQAPAQISADHSQRKVTFGTRTKLKGVSNFGKVTDTLYRGAQPTDEGFANLSKLGINIVVDLRGSGPHERELVTKLGMKYVPLPWHCYSPQDDQFAKFLTLLRESPGQKVFVHCRLGDDRTGMEIAAFRMAEQGWTAQEARKEMIAFGANWFHRAICPELGPYTKHFPDRFKTSPAFESLRSNSNHDSPQSKP
jgi:tyrosine-protein phosphatase SIW14